MTGAAAVIGLGTMGSAVAQRLVEAGTEVHVHDLDERAVERLVGLGATRATATEAAAQPVVLTSLPSDREVTAVVLEGSLLERLTGGTLVELSTTLPETMRAVARAAEAAGVAAVDCPLSGGPQEARAGALSLLVGAEAAALEPVRTLLESLGTIEHVGTPGDGKALKLVNNVMSIGNMLVAAEALVLGRSLGLDTAAMLDVVGRSGGRSTQLTKRAPLILARDFAPRFSLDLGAKDLRLALASAAAQDCPMPAVEAISGIYETARSEGLGGRDMSVLVELYERWAGLEQPPSSI